MIEVIRLSVCVKIFLINLDSAPIFGTSVCFLWYFGIVFAPTFVLTIVSRNRKRFVPLSVSHKFYFILETTAMHKAMRSCNSVCEVVIQARLYRHEILTLFSSFLSKSYSTRALQGRLTSCS